MRPKLAMYDFYDPDLYDDEIGDSIDAEGLIGLYLERAGVGRKSILDIGAGTGRLAVPLAISGHQVLAFDRSTRMLGRLKENCIARDKCH